MAGDEMKKDVGVRRYNPTSKRWRKWLIIVLTLLIAGYGTYSWLRYRANLPLSAFDWDYTADTQIVNLQVGRHRFAIPKNYLFKRDSWTGGQFNYLTLVMMMPDMKPYSADIHDEFMTPDRRLMFIDIKTRRGLPDITQQFKNRTQRYGRADELPNSEISGLRQFAEPGPNGSDLFVQFDGDRLVHSMDCKRSTLSLFPSCKVEIDYSNDVIVSYDFARRYLHDWPSIDARVRALLARFEGKEL